jgi:hypothetical protein
MNSKQFERDADKLDKRRVKCGAYIQSIIREQAEIIDRSEKGIEKINSDLKALRRRLEPYTTKDPKPIDELEADLKFRYQNKLAERGILERAITMAQESIVAAQLNIIPGESRRDGV